MTVVRTAAAPTFEQQVSRLLELDHPTTAGWSARRFRDTVEPLREAALEAEADADPASGNVAALLVVTGAWVPLEVAMADVVWKGRPGRVEMPPTTPADYVTIDAVRLPQAAAYLPARRRHRRRPAGRAPRGRSDHPARARSHAPDHRRGGGAARAEPGDPRRAQRVLAARQPSARLAARPGGVDQLQGAAAGVVLGPQPAHLARVGVRLGTCGPRVVGFEP